MISTSLMNILIIDDETNIHRTLSYCLAKEGHEVISVTNPDDAREEFRRRIFDIAFVDLKLGEADGMELIPVLQSDSPWTKIVVITAYSSIETAVEAIRRGATDYVVKPFTPDQIRLLTRRIGHIRLLENQITTLHEDVQRLGPEERFQSGNAGMQRIIETARKAAQSGAIILLRGESGIGKTVYAKAIHNWSERASHPMVTVACPSVPPDLLESELFGHVKGAYTGAIRDNPGRFAACEGGTLFLDEIGDIAPSVQAKLLRFIQEKEYERLGDSKTRKANVRIIVATNTNLEKNVEEGRFREDLFYRLNVIGITIPPLRERKEDILPLASGFLKYFCKINKKSRLGFTKETEEAFQNYGWPGNVRELRNMIERAVILGNGEWIGISELPGNMAPKTDSRSIGDLVSLSTIEELHIRRVLAQTSSIQEAADILGIDQATLWRRRKKYNI